MGRRMPTIKERETAVSWLQERIKPGSQVWVIKRHQTSRGNPVISYLIVEEGEILNVSEWISEALAVPYDKTRDGLKNGNVTALVRKLSIAMHGDQDVGISEIPITTPITPSPERYVAGLSLIVRVL